MKITVLRKCKNYIYNSDVRNFLLTLKVIQLYFSSSLKIVLFTPVEIKDADAKNLIIISFGEHNNSWFYKTYLWFIKINYLIAHSHRMYKNTFITRSWLGFIQN